MKPRPIEIRLVDPVSPFKPKKKAPQKYTWIKAVAPLDERLPSAPLIQQALTAFASDFGLMSTALQPHGLSFLRPGLHCASLDHALWFHHPL